MSNAHDAAENPDSPDTTQHPQPRRRSRRALATAEIIESIDPSAPDPPDPNETPQARGHKTKKSRAEARAEILAELNAGADSPLNSCTLRQLQFTLTLIKNGGNGTKAAIAAGVSPASAAQYASETRRNPKIIAILRDRIAQTLAEPAATDKEIIRTLSTQLRGDIGDLSDCYDENGHFDLKKAKELGVSRFIKEVSLRRLHDGTTETRVRLHDSQKAAQILGKWAGLDTEAQRNPADIARERAEADRNQVWAQGEVDRLCSTFHKTRDEVLTILRQRGGPLAEILLGSELDGGLLVTEEIIDLDSEPESQAVA